MLIRQQADMEAELAALDAEEYAQRDAEDEAAVDALNAAPPQHDHTHA
jgi:hypothetical protein